MSELKKKVAVLSNVTADLIVEKLRKEYDFYLPEGYDTWVQEVINPEAPIFKERIEAVIVLLDGTETRSWKDLDEATQKISLWKQAINSLVNAMPSIPIFISTIDIRENRIKALSERRYKYEIEQSWCNHIQSLMETRSNVYIFDLADQIAEVGRKHFYSNKMWYLSGMPYSREGLNLVAKEIRLILSSAFESRKKIIVLDLDNTLWGGVIGEDGVSGIELSDHKEGQRYYDFQRQFLEMKNRGIVLGVNSKNNPEDAEEAIQSHPAMLLRDEAFVSKKINWENKAMNIKEMENELNITEGGFIFIDDNPIERETVKGECPEIVVPEFPNDTSELLTFAEDIWFDYCRPLRVLGEDREKTRMYQSEAKRKAEMNSSLSLDDYISKLEVMADIHKMRPEELERVTQLINKTNQFNVTTKRYTASEVQDMAGAPEFSFYVAYSSDKYGDSGLISVIVLEEKSEGTYIDTFIMSCRVMGRKLEDVIIDEIATRCRGDKLIGTYISTKKNAPVKDLYDRLGFKLVHEDSGEKIYELDIENYQKKSFDMYKRIKFEE